MLAEGIAACPVPWQHLAYSSGETEEVTSCKLFSFPPAPSTSRSSFLSRSLEPRSTALLVCRRKATSLAPSVFYLLETSLGSAVWRMAPCVPTGRRREGLLPSCQGRGRTHSMAGTHCLRYKPCLSTEAKGSGLAASRS